MPGTTAVPDIELIIENTGGGGGGVTPPPGGDAGDEGDGGKRPRKWSPSPKRYSTAVTIGIVSILMFFMALASAFIILRRSGEVWVTVHLPRILWVNTLILLGSSFTLERARARLLLAGISGFRKLWFLTTALGFLFVAGQLVAWRQLVAQGVFIATNQASSFFYIFTGAHAVHLLGGVAALLFISLRNFEKSQISLPTATEIASYYWHFMDGLWVFLLALLYLGK
ncbi:MAG TPA: heme-copper oxidase subunit III [Candidatus Acidoferrum sp.]|nr:heme-copper oxidase subunit III [Candidatus Acidoferrum sp.]